jgi:flavin-dependent dehydrogenase
VPRGRWGSAYFDFFPVPDNIAGYVWDFPTQVNGEPMRCWGIYDMNLLAGENRPQLKEPLAQEMSRAGFDLENYEIKGHPIRWFSPDNPTSIPRVLLVGDAVGADPIFGEGISVALGYGNIAAREIKNAFERNDFSFRGYKVRVLTSPLGQALLSRWFIAYIIYPLKWKWFQVLLWRIMKPVVIVVSWIFVLNWGRRMPRP